MKNFFLIISSYLFLVSSVNAETFTTALKKAYLNNSELNAERENIYISEEELKISRGSYLPTITLEGTKSEEDTSKLTNQSGGNASITDVDPLTKSISISQTIFDFGRGAELSKSKIGLNLAKANLLKKEQDILYQTIEAYTGLISADEKLSINIDNVELLGRQIETDLIRVAAQTKKIVNVKKGQFLSHREVENIILKIENQNNNKILITERGNSFGYNYLINDFKGVHFMKQFGYPIVFDSTHSVQLPGGMGIKSGGAREYVVPLSKSAASLRLAGFFIETHPNPDKALSDGPNMMHLHNMPKLLNSINKINKAAK